jgi:hypothetical protein
MLLCSITAHAVCGPSGPFEDASQNICLSAWLPEAQNFPLLRLRGPENLKLVLVDVPLDRVAG